MWGGGIMPKDADHLCSSAPQAEAICSAKEWLIESCKRLWLFYKFYAIICVMILKQSEICKVKQS